MTTTLLKYEYTSQDTMPTPKLTAKHSTYAHPMVLEALPNTPSSAPTEPSLTKNTSSVIGGSTLIAQKPKVSTLWMKTLPLSVKQQLPPKDLPHPHKDHTHPQTVVPVAKLNTVKADKDVQGLEGSKTLKWYSGAIHPIIDSPPPMLKCSVFIVMIL